MVALWSHTSGFFKGKYPLSRNEQWEHVNRIRLETCPGIGESSIFVAVITLWNCLGAESELQGYTRKVVRYNLNTIETAYA